MAHRCAVAGGAFAKLWHDTVADLSANMDAVHADYHAIRATALYRAASPGEMGDARRWTACAGLQEEAVQALDRVQSQIGIVFLSKAVDQVIADGCEMGATALSVDGLAEAFDARAELYRWRWFAALLVATHGGSLEAHQGLRDIGRRTARPQTGRGRPNAAYARRPSRAAGRRVAGVSRARGSDPGHLLEPGVYPAAQTDQSVKWPGGGWPQRPRE